MPEPFRHGTLEYLSGFYDLPKRHGKLKELKKFDAQFFQVTPKQANYMDPQVRILLEVAWEAMIDAGESPLFLDRIVSLLFSSIKKLSRRCCSFNMCPESIRRRG